MIGNSNIKKDDETEKKEEEKKDEVKKEEKAKKNFSFIKKKGSSSGGDTKSSDKDPNQKNKSPTNNEDLDKLMKATSSNSKTFELLNNIDKNKEHQNEKNENILNKSNVGFNFVKKIPNQKNEEIKSQNQMKKELDKKYN